MNELLYKLFQKHRTVCTDSRQVTPDSIFFALKGDNFDGNRYACEAIKAGAACAVIDETQFAADHRCLLVDDVLSTLQQLANYHRMNLDIPVIGITGSNGKTTTKELLAAVLSAKFKTRFTAGNLNNHIGVPLTLLSVSNDDQMAVVEMGANHQGEIAQLCAIAQPNIGLITNIGRAHLEGFGGFDGVIKAKTELYHHLKASHGVVFVNADDPVLMHHSSGIKRITYGSDAGADYRGTVVQDGPMLVFSFSHQGTNYRVGTNLIGRYNFANAMAAVAVGLEQGVAAADVVSALEGYRPTNNRSQWITTQRNHVVMDAYNANPSSMEAALAVFATLETDRHRVMILGEMLELGEDSSHEHDKILQKAMHLHPARLILVGDGYKGLHREWYPNVQALAGELGKAPISQALILVKGSRGNRLETILPLL